MSENRIKELEDRVAELEAEVEDREKDLATFREELNAANRKLESLIISLNSELDLAQVIQKKLIPTEFPNIPGFEISSKFLPSMVKGGDYYDLFEHEDPNRFGIILAASSGYSMSALLLSVLLKLTGQMEARRGAEPSAVLKDMANELLPNTQVGDQAEIFYGVVDRRTYDLKYCLAGSVIGFHQDYSSGEIELLDVTSKSLQMGAEGEFQHKVKRLNPRDRLILLSPGFGELVNLDGEKYGLERVLRSVTESPKRGVHEVRNEVLYRATQFSKGKDQPRDLTVVVLEVKDRVIKLAKG